MYLKEALEKTRKARREARKSGMYVSECDGEIIRADGARYSDHMLIDDKWLPYEEPKCEWCVRLKLLESGWSTLAEQSLYEREMYEATHHMWGEVVD